MSSALKCPNPSCPYLFDPTRVPAGVVLTCPRCGMRFTLGPPQPATAPTATFPGIPAGTATATFPGTPAVASETRTATTTQPKPPPTPPGPPEKPKAGAPRKRRPPPAAGGSGWLGYAVVGVVALAFLGAIALTIYLRLFHTPGPRSKETAASFKELNLAVEPPAAPWERDEDMRAKLAMPNSVVYHRAEPEAFMAFGAKDFDTRPPRPSEVRDGLNTPLTKLFEDIRQEPIDGAKWLGQPAVAFQFRARHRNDGPTVGGECYAVTYQGIAYWFLGWAGEADVGEQFPAFEAARGRFRLLGEREKWRPRESPVVPFHGDRFDYRLLDAEGIWKPADRKAEEEDPRADLFLVAKLKKRGADFADEAELLVYVLDAGGDPLADARKYVESRMNADPENRGTNTFTELTGEPEGDPSPNTVDATAPVVRLRTKNDRSASYSWLIVISAIRVGDKVVAVHARCPWKDRGTFETKLIQMASSLREGR